MTKEELDRLGKTIVDAIYTVHKELGPGLLESAYELALEHELRSRGLKVERHLPVHLVYKKCDLGKSYELDLFVEDAVIIEVKSVLEMHPIFTAQIITHLRLSHNRLGYLVNFNVLFIKNGIKRIVYKF